MTNKLLKSYIRKEWETVFLAFLLCMYYVMPKFISVSLELLFLFYLIRTPKFRTSRVRRIPVTWYLFFSLCLFFTNIFTIDSESVNYLTTCVNNFLFIVISCLLFSSQDRIKLFLISFGFISILLMIALVPIVMQMMIEGGATQLGASSESSSTSFLQNPINLGYILLLINMCQFYGVVITKNKIMKLYFVSLFCFSMFCILLAGSRKAVIACLIYLGTYFVVSNRRNKSKLFLYFVVLFVLVYVSCLIIMNVEILYWSIGRRMEGLIGYFDPKYADVDPSTESRANLINLGKQIFYENPFFGLGIKDSHKILVATHPHNNYLTCLDFGGLLTFASYYWFHFRIYLNFYRYGAIPKMGVLLLGLMIAFALVDYTATTYNIIYFPFFLTIIYLSTILPNFDINHIKPIIYEETKYTIYRK